jgi:hypothetical protein
MMVLLIRNGIYRMKKFLIIPVILFTMSTAEADQNKLEESGYGQGFDECVAVSLFTIQGRELNSIVKDSRSMEKTNTIPEGWTVIGVTTKSEPGNVAPYMVICR